MSRPIVLSNGELHVGINNFGMVHDFYYPYVGLENHSSGEDPRHKIGVYCDGQISWLDDCVSGWTFKFTFPYNALIGHTIAKNEKLGLILEFDDFVDSYVSVFVRNIHVVNLRPEKREIKLFMHQAFIISDSRSNTDTAQYLPDNNAVLHYRGRRAFIVSGRHNGQPFDQYTVGLFGIEGKEGTFRDADDGELGENNVEHGRVDSTLRFTIKLDSNSSQRVHYWIACGTSLREALHIHKQVQHDSDMEYQRRTADWWDEWLKPAYNIIGKVPSNHRQSFIQTLMILKSQIDKRGAIIASTDTSMLNYSRDAYAYCWPRDGAFVLWPLIRMGYQDEAYRFFEFVKKGLHHDGYMMHKYRADGALGSSWHPYLHGDVVTPPIQEDETALPLFMFVQYYNMHPDANLLKNFYNSMVVPMADFLTEFIDRRSGLPKASYNIWEEIFATNTYTVSVTYAALIAVSDLAQSVNDPDNAVKWRSAANDIQEAAKKHLYSADRKVIRRGISFNGDELVYDDVVDNSCVFGAYIFGLFGDGSEEITNSIETIKQLFGVNDGAIGLPRYENDVYRRVSPGITGNSWFITTLWLAQYYVDHNMDEKTLSILDWAKDHSMSTGVMSEQVDPVTHQIISPAPLTWTHAEYASTILDLVAKQKSS